MADKSDRYCFAWLETIKVSGLDRAALWNRAKWIPSQRIRVAFLEGSQALRDRVFATAKQWIGPGMAKLELELRNDPNDSDVRIAFKQGNGSWSAIGTTCQLRKKTDATMNFGWLTDGSSDEDVREVVLHEFGHALGLIHEHQNPAGGIKWRKDVIYAELSEPPNSWSKEQIDSNMFVPWEKSETNFTKVDPESIMMYPIPKRWTLDGFSAGTNTKLSKTDKEFIAREYR